MTKPAGLVLIAGFVRENQPRRFRFRELLEQRDWQCWICRAQDIEAAALGEETLGSHDERWWQ